MNVSIEITDEMVEAIAKRAAEIVAGETDAESTSVSGYLDVAAAAEFLACPPSRIYKLVSARRLPHCKDGSRLLFDPGELREYVRNGGARCP